MSEIEQDAAYWRERYEIERGEVETKDAEIARLTDALGVARQMYFDAVAAVLEDYEQAHAERDALHDKAATFSVHATDVHPYIRHIGDCGPDGCNCGLLDVMHKWREDLASMVGA